MSEGHYGVSLLNDCKYGHSVLDGSMALTLIKSGIEPNPTTDQEEHFFTYALLPHAGDWRNGTVREAYCLNQPALSFRGGKAGSEFSLASVGAPNVVLETVKQAEDGDGWIVRLYECDNARTDTCLRWFFPWRNATASRKRKRTLPSKTAGFPSPFCPMKSRPSGFGKRRRNDGLSAHASLRPQGRGVLRPAL